MTDTLTLVWTGQTFQSNTSSSTYGITGTNMTVNWGDGTTESVSSGTRFSHTYSSNSTYTITITGDSITGLGDSCFQGCTGLTSITIPSSVTSIGTTCFRDCTGLTSITIPSSVTSLGTGCFFECTSLTSITIPSGVTRLGLACFSNCTGLTSIVFKSLTPPTVSSSNAWNKLPTACKISVPKEGLSAYTSASNYPSSSVYTYIIDVVGELCNRIYPIGCIYISTSADDPATLFGGTWTQIKDKFLLACGDTYNNGATGGAATVTLTTDQIPSHAHEDHRWNLTGSNGGNTGTYTFKKGTYLKFANADADFSIRNTEGIIGGSGGGAHNNMPPYQVIYIWKRTA